MNRLNTAAAMLFLASQLSVPVWAERSGPDRMDPKQAEERKEKREEKMLERLTKKLALTADQQKSVGAVLDKQGDKLETMNKEFAEKRKALLEDTDGQISQLLNNDQKKEFSQWKADKKERYHDRKERLGDRKK